MAWTWYDSKVVRIEEVTPQTRRFWVEVESEEPLNFKAGQFVTMDLPIHERRNKRWRSYSIANPPTGGRELEFCIVRLEGGAATRYFFEEVRVGTPIRFKGPSGTFTLPEKVETDLVFIGTGTGVAPFRSMLWDLAGQNKPHKNIHLIFGTRYREGILYQEEWAELSEKMPGFAYSVALSREKDLPELPGGAVRSGYVHQFYLDRYKDVRPDIDFYICGWSNMIDEAVENLLLKLGYDKKQIHYELYG
ncbi:MAG: oxidoreductase [Bacteroidetes bacterium]|nr:MAG: oxidoreductase [Bacteroidota bacterium]